jgi:hypothetical protein
MELERDYIERNKRKLPLDVMKSYGRVGVFLHVLMTLTQDGGQWLTSPQGKFLSGTHWTGG